MSTEKIYKTAINLILNHFKGRDTEKEFLHLDIGSGSGDLVKLLKKQLNTKSSCCDYTEKLIELPGQQVDLVNLNVQKDLPYETDKFDIVTATEIIEHLEDFRATLSEMYRVLKPGGICILSTPNILNLNSRLRYLWFGFAELMGPLPIADRNIESCAGHISPVSIYYIMHALQELSFQKIDFTVDKYQRSGIWKAMFLYLPIRFFSLLIKRKEIKKYGTIDESNEKMINYLNSLQILLGRTVIVSATK